RHRHPAATFGWGRNGLQFFLGGSVPFVHDAAALLGDYAGFVLEGLLLEVLEGFPDGRFHIAGLGGADQRADAAVCGGLPLMAVLFDSENDLCIELIAQDFADFVETSFYFFAIGGSYFVVPASVFHSHGTSKLRHLQPALQNQLWAMSGARRRTAHTQGSW